MARPNQEAIDTFSNTTGIPEADNKRNQNRIKIIKIRQECFPTLRLPNRVADIIDGLPNDLSFSYVTKALISRDSLTAQEATLRITTISFFNPVPNSSKSLR
ncbi:hypothetical protein SLEP1_g33193 [Rubroshorea leprosula]|uniref:Uncharacterized protein n=1 Tax=Rubroshorea leprosula TaxID=152421 RepID=A0AAV5KFV6_9ROSI|nr:hypothetical protein SLEP1_g33193 [Rubroshorea leprosula]